MISNDLFHISILSPKFFLTSLFHIALTLRTGLLIPYPDIVAAALKTQSSHLAPIRWGHISNDTTHHDILDGMAVGTRHGSYLLTEQSAPLIHLSLISTIPTAIFPFPSHSQVAIMIGISRSFSSAKIINNQENAKKSSPYFIQLPFHFPFIPLPCNFFVVLSVYRLVLG